MIKPLQSRGCDQETGVEWHAVAIGLVVDPGGCACSRGAMLGGPCTSVRQLATQGTSVNHLGKETCIPHCCSGWLVGRLGRWGCQGRSTLWVPRSCNRIEISVCCQPGAVRLCKHCSWVLTVHDYCHSSTSRESGLQEQQFCASNIHLTRVRSSRVARLRCCHCQLRQFALVQATHLEDTPRAAAQAPHHDISRCVAD